MEFNRYFTNAEIDDHLTTWVQTYPKLISVEKIGVSYEKRPIWLATITNQDSGPAGEKPAVWVDANIHATEIAGTTVAMRLIHTLLTGKDDPQIAALLDQCTFYIVPRFNPDGAGLALGPRPRYLRSGVRSYPIPELDDGLHEEDIDGDGRILQMRITDPYGDWKISSQDSRLMEKRGPAEHGGTYYRLLPEGTIENYDGYLVRLARPLQGLDFNRNFPYEWRPENDQQGAGPYPTSEIEIRTVVDFITKHPNINFAITYHTFSRVILRPYSTHPDDDMETDDLWVYELIANLGSQITGYRNASVFHDFKYHPKEVITGGFDDWGYDHLGMFTFTIELWDLPDASGLKDRKFIEWYRKHPHDEDVQILHWVLENGGPDIYIDWYPFQHPQLGPVEIGGWDRMYSWRNPPHRLMGEEAARQVPFVLAMGDMLPHLSLHTLSLTTMGNSDYHLNLVVENTGFLPTSTTKQGSKRNAARPVRVELELPEGVSIVSGKARTELGHLQGRSNKLDVASLWESSPTDNRARCEWVLHAQSGASFRIHILSDRAGTIHREITIP
jgi:murein tripeptide amidase MpaA